MQDYMLLKNTKGMTDGIFNHIFETRGTIKGIFDATFEELYATGLASVVVENIVGKKYDEKFVDNELTIAQKNNVQIITREDSLYPELLRNIYCPPAYFYAKGDVACLKENTIGMVGSRKPSRAGEQFAGKIAEDLASVGFTVVSGFAYGIDIASHLGALKKGPTVAVLGSGLLDLYPKSHIKYAKSVVENGCILTEFPFNEPPISTNFPRRNRIISGLSLGVIVVEASRKSGSLITARFAMEQNRIVFAVPHFPGSTNSAGNELIKDGAKLTESYLDIISEFKDTVKRTQPLLEEDVSTTPVFDDPLEAGVYQTLSVEPKSSDELCSVLDVGIVDVMVATAQLEIKGYIIKDDTGRFIPVIGVENG